MNRKREDQIMEAEITKIQISERMQQGFAELKKAMQSFAQLQVSPAIAKQQRYAQSADALNDAGWLPHNSTPFDQVDKCNGDVGAVYGLLSQFYSEKGPEVFQDIKGRLSGYAIDDEAKTAFSEALSAYEAGLHRCVCRTLMPEIERVVRIELHDDDINKRITSQKDLQEWVGQLPISSVEPGGFWVANLDRRLSKHLYKEVNERNRQQFEEDSVPNRHAVVHGIVTYYSMQNSLNAIFMTEFIFQVVSLLKRMSDTAAE